MIPKILHRTIRSFDKLEHTEMSNYAQLWTNMGFEVRNYTDQDCDRYVENCLRGDDYEAYCNLIPRVLRTDIWRLCVLYAEGGVYADVHIKPLINVASLLENEIDHLFVIDHDNKRVYNAFVMVKKESPLIMTILQRSLTHVKEQIYTNNVLDITGPGVMGYVLRQILNQPNGLEEKSYPYRGSRVLFMSHMYDACERSSAQEYIVYESKPVFKCRYPNYRKDMLLMGTDSRYENYFHRRILYKRDLEAVVAFVNGHTLEPMRISHKRFQLEKTMNDEYM